MTNQTVLLLITSLSLFVLLFIWNIILSVKLRKSTKRLNRFTRGTNTTNLEQIIEQYQSEMAKLKSIQVDNTEHIKVLLNKITKLKGYIGVVRYNAFSENGNDLSYSIAIIDEKKNGVVITSIYNRGETNTYGKPVLDGQSSYKLSKEELEAIEQAIKLK